MLKRYAATFLLPFFFASCRQQQAADLIIYNGVVYTVDSAFTMAEAIAVKDGDIVAVGTSKDIQERYKATEMVDAHGQAVYPGLIDAHAHFLGYGRSRYEVGLYECTNWAAAIEKVKAYAARDTKVLWIRGRGWDQNLYPGKEYPDNKELNELFPDRPVLLDRIDGHAAIANAKALELAGITADTKLTGGKVEVKNGKPTGLLIDNVVDLVARIVPKPTRAEHEQWLGTAEADCYALGVTTVADCGLPYEDVMMIDSLQREGKLNMNLYVMLSDDGSTYKKYMQWRATALAGNDADARKHFAGEGPYKTSKMYVRGVKAYADGALGSRGACLLKHYADKPGWGGFLLSPPEHFDSLAQMLVGTDMQLCTHAIGDSGNRMALHIYKRHLQGRNDKRWRIEHAQVVDPADIDMFGECSVVPSVQPTHATSDMYWAGDRLGADRIRTAYAYKQLLQQNGWLPLGTDFPVEEISPFRTFLAATARVDAKGYPEGGFQPQEALSREEALRGMTIWAAKGCFMENEVGSIEVGKKADLVIMDKDLMKAAPGDVLKTKVVATYARGRKMK
ncbi:amidohydrolase [Nemorincola caseinilytica]|uniref:Amidohydrolase n=1 Tax=Nemorincola caseinilytica TaxID=2054315 RepID=A0ABP8N4M5_9BACT